MVTTKKQKAERKKALAQTARDKRKAIKEAKEAKEAKKEAKKSELKRLVQRSSPIYTRFEEACAQIEKQDETFLIYLFAQACYYRDVETKDYNLFYEIEYVEKARIYTPGIVWESSGNFPSYYQAESPFKISYLLLDMLYYTDKMKKSKDCSLLQEDRPHYASQDEVDKKIFQTLYLKHEQEVARQESIDFGFFDLPVIQSIGGNFNSSHTALVKIDFSKPIEEIVKTVKLIKSNVRNNSLFIQGIEEYIGLKTHVSTENIESIAKNIYYTKATTKTLASRYADSLFIYDARKFGMTNAYSKNSIDLFWHNKNNGRDGEMHEDTLNNYLTFATSMIEEKWYRNFCHMTSEE